MQQTNPRFELCLPGPLSARLLPYPYIHPILLLYGIEKIPNLKCNFLSLIERRPFHKPDLPWYKIDYKMKLLDLNTTEAFFFFL